MRHYKIKKTSDTEPRTTGASNTPQRNAKLQKQKREEPKNAGGLDIRIKNTGTTSGLSIARIAPNSSVDSSSAKAKRGKKRKGIDSGIGIAGTSTSTRAVEQKSTKGGISIATSALSKEPTAQTQKKDKGGVSIWGTGTQQQKKQKTNQAQQIHIRSEKKQGPKDTEKSPAKRRSIFGHQMQRVLQQSRSQDSADMLANNDEALNVREAAQEPQPVDDGISIANTSNSTNDNEKGEIGLEIKSSSLSREKNSTLKSSHSR